jgi:hypothetical protein
MRVIAECGVERGAALAGNDASRDRRGGFLYHRSLDVARPRHRETLVVETRNFKRENT